MASLVSLIKLPLVTAGTAFLSLVTATSSMAITLTGTTIGQPTYNRPSTTNNPPTTLSPTATNVPFAVNNFTVATNGVYNFNTTAPGFDYSQFLYENNFNSTQPLSNILFTNNPFNSGSNSFNYSLTTGTDYFLVTSGFSNTITGAFSSNVTPVPEPSEVNTLAFGAIGAAYLLKRRFKKIAV